MFDHFNIASLALLSRQELEGLLQRYLAAQPYASAQGQRIIAAKINTIRTALSIKQGLC